MLVAKNRWQAFGIHLVISLFLFLLCVGIIYFIWYPDFFFVYGGGIAGMKLIAAVDFIIGPGLTLVVYQAGKKGLKFDMTLIGLVQVVCLSYGMWAVWETKPMALVYVNGGFKETNKIGYQLGDQGLTEVPYLNLVGGPAWLSLKNETVIKNYDRWEWNSIWVSREPYAIERYQSLDIILPALNKTAGMTIEQANEVLEEPITKSYPNNVKLLPLAANAFSFIVAIDSETGKLLDFYVKNVDL